MRPTLPFPGPSLRRSALPWLGLCALLLAFPPGGARAGDLVLWEASSGLLPDEIIVPYALTDTVAAANPVLGASALTLTTTAAGEVMQYELSGAGLNIGNNLDIQVRLRMAGGAPGAPAAQVQVRSSFGRVAVGFGPDLVFLRASGSSWGTSAAVDTDDAFHTYRIRVMGGASHVTVEQDGSQILSGYPYGGGGSSGYYIRFGNDAEPASTTGTSEWEFVQHNAGVLPDTDDDGLDDLADNCVSNPNPQQEDSDGDGAGDVCDADTINPLLSAVNDGSGALHARTPSYRMKISPADGLQLAQEGGIGAVPMPGIGYHPPDPVDVMQLGPTGASGLVGAYAPATPTLVQSTWQTVLLGNAFVSGTGEGIDGHLATFANGVALGYEVPLASIAPGSDLDLSHALTLPTGWSLDTSELSSGVGRITVVDDSMVPRFRISSVEVMAFGSQTVVSDTGGFHGITRLQEEIQTSTEVASVGPPDLVGSDLYHGVHAPLVQTSYTLSENMADGALGESGVTGAGPVYTLTLTAPAAVVDRNRATSTDLFVGVRISSLTPVDLGTGSPGVPAPTVHGRHLVFFDDEADVTGTEVDLVLHNDMGTFDGAAPDYTLFPNNGGTAALYDAAEQQQTGFGCAGCSMALLGTSSIDFPGGGVGVGIAPGPRLASTHPCTASSPLNVAAGTGRCAAGRNLRGSFTANDLSVTGSMAGLVASESDVALDSFVFHQSHDPNVTDPTLLHGVMGLGCSADAGLRIGINPATDDPMANVPVDTTACPGDSLGQGACQPPALSTPATTGLCNLTVDRVELEGLGSTANPLGTDLTLPAGVGIALHMRHGTGRVGDLVYDALGDACIGTLSTAPSSVRGFEALASFSGGANVNEVSGQPLTHDDPDAVAPTVYCFSNVLGDELGAGLLVGGNVDVRAQHLEIASTLMGAVHVANPTANVEDLTTSTGQGAPCRSVDAETCATPVQELACPDCKPNGFHFVAATTSGRSAPTRLTVADSILGLGPSGAVSGGNPALPPLVLDGDLVATGGGLTIGRRLAGLHRPPVHVSLGADTMFDPAMLSITLTDNNIGVDTAAIAIDNFDSAGGMLNMSLVGNCYSSDGATCITAGSGVPVIGAAAAAGEVTDLNTTALGLAAAAPNANAGTFLPEPSPGLAFPFGVAAVAALHARRRRREPARGN